MNRYRKELAIIEATDDLLARSLLVAGLVSRVFREVGWELIVVGGSAIEFYTEGSYMSGDIDLCRKSIKPIPPRLAQDVFGLLGATGGPRTWKLAGLYVDLLGFFECETTAPDRVIETELGSVNIMPAELAIVERVLTAFYPQLRQSDYEVSKKLLAVTISGKISVDWEEIDRLAQLPDFRIYDELQMLKQEVTDEIRH